MKNNYPEAARRGRRILAACTAILMTGFVSKAQVLIPTSLAASTSASIACGTNTILMDHAGASNYANTIDGYVVIYAGAGAQINLNGTYDTESCCDPIRIYDGVGTGGTLLNQIQGTGGTFNQTYGAGQTITVRFTTDGSVVYAGINFSVSFSGPCVFTPCSATPANNTVVATNTLVCPVFGTSTLNVLNQYSLSALSFSWQSAANQLGPYTNIPNANGVTGSQLSMAYVTPTLAADTWYQVVITCTNGGVTTTASPIQVQVAPVTINTTPYFEGFEGITNNGNLPNCSWTRSDVIQCATRTASVSNWRQARTGNKFAEFDVPNQVWGNTRYFYSNGIVLNAGVTYSASVWYNTPGFSSWGALRLSYGPNQSPNGLVMLANVQNPNNTVYQPMSNTFSVVTTGTYYLAVQATNNFSSSQLVWDDLAITSPCQFPNNAANIVLSGTTTICAGQTVNINATGAATYTWSNNQNGSSIAVAPGASTVYNVTGTNPFSGCLGSATRAITVNQLPNVSILTFNNPICYGASVSMQAFGANTFTWSSNGSTSPAISVMPTQNTTYTVIGTDALGCTNSAVQTITVNQLPVISVTGSTLICENSSSNLTASGAGNNGSYSWASPSLFLQANPVSVMPMTTTAYTVSGTDANECKGSAVVVVAVDPCLGLENINGTATALNVYPNPNNGVFTVVKADGVLKNVEVMDVTGRVVLSTNSDASNVEINISNLSNGVYYVKVTSDNATEVVKIVKN